MFDIRTFVPEGMEGEEFSEGTVYLDDEMTPELEKEALLAETIRAIQQKRKEAELNVEDEVEISFSGDTQPLKQNKDEILSRVNLSSLDFDGKSLEHSGSVEFEGREIVFSFSGPVE
jgi:isoleucyl-tRNA synthetase